MALLILALPWFTAPLRADERPWRILMLHAYNYTFPATSLAADGARERLLQRSRRKIEFDAEYLDLVRFSEPGHERLVADFLRERYAQRRPDIVMAISGEALPFVIKHRDAFAPGVPVVFVGAASGSLASVSRPPGVTGHFFDLAFNFREMLALAERLQPQAKRLFVIAGTARLDKIWQDIARTEIERRARKFETTYLFDLEYGALREATSRIPSDAIVLGLSVFRDGAGKTFLPVDVANTLAGLSPAPVYTPYVSQLGKGLLGGFGETFDAMGRAGADVVLDILGGKDASSIPPRANPESSHRVDYRALQRWNLSESNLPPRTVMLNKPPSIWEQHRNAVLAATGAFALQTVALGALLVQRRRRQRAEALLKDSEERLAFAAAAANIGIWRLDVGTGGLWATEHCRAMFGLSRTAASLTLDGLLDAVHPEDRHFLADSFKSATQFGTQVNTEFRIAIPDREIRWLVARGHSAFDDAGRPSRISGIFADITARKTAEAEADHQRKEVAHLMRVSVLGELSGAIAHELNQPLTAILAYAQAARRLLARKNPDLGKIMEVLNDITLEDDRASEVIRRLHKLLRKGESRTEPINLNELVESTLRLLNSEAISRRIKVDTDFQEGLPGTFGDPVQLQQVLLNLLMNAMDAMSGTSAPERLLVVGTRSSGSGAVEVSVSDRGRGIAEEQRSQLFKPFFTTKEHGLGLGLSICSKIVKAHEGKLSVDNNPDRGATAVLALPIKINAAPVS